MDLTNNGYSVFVWIFNDILGWCVKVRVLVRELCKLHSFSEPLELEKMEQASSSILLSPPPSAPSDAPSDDEEDLEDMDMHIEMEEESVADKSKDEGIK